MCNPLGRSVLCHPYLITASYIICKEKLEVVFQTHANARNPKEENNLYFKTNKRKLFQFSEWLLKIKFVENVNVTVIHKITCRSAMKKGATRNFSEQFTRFGMILYNDFIFLTGEKNECGRVRICSKSHKDSAVWHLLPFLPFDLAGLTFYISSPEILAQVCFSNNLYWWRIYSPRQLVAYVIVSEWLHSGIFRETSGHLW